MTTPSTVPAHNPRKADTEAKRQPRARALSIERRAQRQMKGGR